MMNPNDFDHFDTQIHSDELIPDGYEDRLEEGDWEPEGDPAGDPDDFPYGWDVEQEEFPW
jgi:hypothetical protein